MRLIIRGIISLLIIAPSFVLAQKVSTEEEKFNKSLPSYTASDSKIIFDKSLQVYFEGTINSTAITNSFVSAMSGYIAEEQKDDVSKKLKESNRLGFDLQSGAIYKSKIKGNFLGTESPKLIYGYKYRSHLNAKFNDDFFELLLRGNKQYEGETVDIGENKFNFLSYQGLYFGVEKETSKITYGASIGLIKANSFANGNVEGSIYTAPGGSYMDFDVNGEFAYTKPTGTPFFSYTGGGASINLYLEKMTKSGSFKLKVEDLGVLSLSKVTTYSTNSEGTYEGVEIDNVFEFNANSSSIEDSLKSEFNIEEEDGNKAFVIPAIIRANYVHRFSEKFEIDYGVKYILTSHYLPRVIVTPYYGRLDKIQVSATIAYGGFGNTDIGIGARKQLDIKKNKQGSDRVFRYFLGVNTYFLENWLMPKTSSGKGLSMQFSSYF